MFRTFQRALLLALVLLLLAPQVPAVQAAGTFTVTNANDSGAGSLRQAITDAIASGGNATVAFTISGTITINLASSLPELTANNITIDGPLDASGKPRVALNGTSITAANGAGQGLQIRSSGNTVRGLAIYGFSGIAAADVYGAGILLTGTGATNNLIESNFIGTNLAGDALGQGSGNNNQYGGIVLENGASSNTIRSNLISGNGRTAARYGVFVGNPGSNTNQTRQNVIRDNKIGVNFAGTAAIGNAAAGVYLSDYAVDNVVGPGNIISGNGSGSTSSSSANYGVVVGPSEPTATGNIIRGNRIGVSSTGAALPNLAGGIKLDRALSTTIGGANAADSNNDDRGNIIASNQFTNIFITQTNGALGQQITNTQIRNNFIGMVSATTGGTTTATGIQIERSVSAVTINGNTISANTSNGIDIYGSNTLGTPTAIIISNNRIGPNAAGTAGITGSQNNGISLSVGVNNVGISGNTITGNKADGVRLSGVSNIAIANNGIGTLSGANAIGNGVAGVEILGSSTGVVVGPGNTVAAHLAGLTGDGVLITDSGTSGNTVKGNSFTGNHIAIRVDNGATGNVIGYAGSELGTNGSSDGNRVRDNQQGIVINGSATVRNRISRTTTSNNVEQGSHFGIQVVGGANASIPAPTLSGVTFSGGSIAGTINTGSADCTGSGCVIEIFQHVINEPNEGKYFLTSFAKTTNGSGAFSVAVASCMPFLTFTTTDRNGNTSQFSSVVNIPSGCSASEPVSGAVPDLFNLAPASFNTGAAISSGSVEATFTADLRNTGDQSGIFDLVVSAPNGWTNLVATPNPSPSLAGGGSQSTTITFKATVPQNTAAGSYNVQLTATAQGSTASDTVIATVVVPLVPGVSLGAASPDTKPGALGAEVCFVHQLSNLGNGPDQFAVNITPPNGWSARTIPASPISLPLNGVQDIQVCVTVPAGAAGGNHTLSVVAQSQTSPNPSSATRTDTVTVQQAAVPSLSTAAAQNADPGETRTYNHALTNIGNVDDDFAIDVTLPAGWTMVTPPPATSGNLAAGSGSFNFSYTVQVPADALAGPYSITVTATAQSAPNLATSVNDTLNVNKIAALDLAPSSQNSAEDPGAVVTYTLMLSNDGNFTDTILVAVTNVSQEARGWTASVEPGPTVTLAPGESTQLSLVVRVPFGQPTSVVNVTTVQATSSLPATSESATATTTINPVAGVQLSPETLAKGAIPGEELVFQFTLLNSGSLDQDFSTDLISTDPATATVTLEGVADEPLAPGETRTITVRIPVPATQPEGTAIQARVRATASPSGLTDEALAIAQVGPPYGVQVDPDRQGTALPGFTISYTQYVTNTGRLDDSIALRVRSSLGWRVSVTPSIVRLGGGASAPVVVTVVVPTSAGYGAIDTTVLTGRSVGDDTITDEATSVTRVGQVAGASLSADARGLVWPGQTTSFLHTLLNTGNGSDTYTISVTQDLDWPVTIQYFPPITKHARGVPLPVQVTVEIPADADPYVRNVIIIRATSRANPTVYSEVVDTFFETSRIFLPTLNTAKP